MRVASLSVAGAGAVLAASLALAHPPGHGALQTQPKELPGPGRNLQVLPADIEQERLLSIMRHWAEALGVQCSHCHVPGNFRSDANPHKNIARGMVRMTIRINEELLPPVVGAAEQPRVDCRTCHRGSTDTELPPPPERAPPNPAPGATPPQPVRPPDVHVAPDTPARPH
jgi:hypothetical protein